MIQVLHRSLHTFSKYTLRHRRRPMLCMQVSGPISNGMYLLRPTRSIKFVCNGSSGGCHQTYTVIANTTVTTPTCQNVTAHSELSVSGTVPLGVLSNRSYIDQCTSLSVTPLTGKPPFTLTVAPSFHPPYNVTSNTMDPISWQVSLPEGYHFFMALSSSDGLLWGNGPMRVGGLGPTDRLVPKSIPQTTAVSIIVGTGVGGIVLGLVIGVLAYVFFSSGCGGGGRDLHPKIISQANTSLQQNRIKRHQSFLQLSAHRRHYNVHTSNFSHQL